MALDTLTDCAALDTLADCVALGTLADGVACATLEDDVTNCTLGDAVGNVTVTGDTLAGVLTLAILDCAAVGTLGVAAEESNPA